MAAIPLSISTHSKQVCSLYKRALRSLESWYDRRETYRYRAVILRARFDKNYCVPDKAAAAQLLADGERELFLTQHWQPRKFQYSVGGCAYERTVTPPDWVLDYWDPLEKAQYPKYFATREKRKKAYVTWWEKQYGKPGPDDLPHH